jgi:hypothetical protein
MTLQDPLPRPGTEHVPVASFFFCPPLSVLCCTTYSSARLLFCNVFLAFVLPFFFFHLSVVYTLSFGPIRVLWLRTPSKLCNL